MRAGITMIGFKAMGGFKATGFLGDGCGNKGGCGLQIRRVAAA
jgi:hypothetical protein